MRLLQIVLYLLLFTAMVAFAVIGGGINGLFFYPKPVQQRVFDIGLSDPKSVTKKECAS